MRRAALSRAWRSAARSCVGPRRSASGIRSTRARRRSSNRRSEAHRLHSGPGVSSPSRYISSASTRSVRPVSGRWSAKRRPRAAPRTTPLNRQPPRPTSVVTAGASQCAPGDRERALEAREAPPSPRGGEVRERRCKARRVEWAGEIAARAGRSGAAAAVIAGPLVEEYDGQVEDARKSHAARAPTRCRRCDRDASRRRPPRRSARGRPRSTRQPTSSCVPRNRAGAATRGGTSRPRGGHRRVARACRGALGVPEGRSGRPLGRLLTVSRLRRASASRRTEIAIARSESLRHPRRA